MKRVEEKNARKVRRKKHIRKRLSGTAAKPRITVFRSNKYIYIQAIDDLESKTLVSITSLSSDMKSIKNNVEDAAKLGEAFGKKMIEKKIKTAVFDRNGYKYHGIVKAIADGARKAGLGM